MISRIDYLLNLSDEYFLQYCSTSPHAEAEDFVETSKNNLRFLKANPSSEGFFCGAARIWKRNETGKWIQL